MEQTNALKSKIEEILKTLPYYVANSGDLKYNIIKEDAQTGDRRLLELLLQNETLKTKFFKPVLDSLVFDTHKFCEVLEYSSGCNSYSKYLGKQIGLYFGDTALADCSDVVLNFPFKDCVLEGGQTKEEGEEECYVIDNSDQIVSTITKRREVFYNEILAQDEIDTLFAPKAFCNAKRYDATAEGNNVTACTTLKRNLILNRRRNLPDDTITDNLIIKGNNLLALHSLEKEFAGKVKLIYIDPPYNTGNDSFAYNDKFNHSSWLTFMKNRLEVAKRLLKDDGCIFISIDQKEVMYLMVLLNDVFGRANYKNIITIQRSAISGPKVINPGVVNVSEYLLVYQKSDNWSFNRAYSRRHRDLRYNLLIENIEDDYQKWTFIPLLRAFENHKGKSLTALRKEFGEDILEAEIDDFTLKNIESVIRFANLDENSVSAKAVEYKKKSIATPDTLFKVDRENKQPYFIINGKVILFYKDRVRMIDGILSPSEPVSDIWTDVLPNDIHNEGGVEFKKGKKPEKLISRIIEIATNPHDIVLDYHLGSGTTAAVAHKMGRQYIGVEQMNYGKNDSVVRLKNVLEGNDTHGISKATNWQGGGSFIYAELAEKNERAIVEITACKSYDELIALFDSLCQRYFLHYNVHIKEFRQEIAESEQFKNLTLEIQKEMFCRMLDLNQLYINFSDRHDTSNGLTDNDITFSEAFYRTTE